MGRIALFTFIVVVSFLIIRVAVRAWAKADIKEKLRKADEIRANLSDIEQFEVENPDIKEKNKKVNEFKKETL